LHKLIQPLLFLICTGSFALLDPREELAAFGTPVVDESVNILPQTRHGLLHLRIKPLGAHQTGNQVVEGLVYPSILRQDCVALP
jgi:hypothetical protein